VTIFETGGGGAIDRARPAGKLLPWRFARAQPVTDRFQSGNQKVVIGRNRGMR